RHLGHLLAFAEHPLGLPELADDLLGGVSPSLHLRRSSLAQFRGPVGLSQGADRFQGVMPGLSESRVSRVVGGGENITLRTMSDLGFALGLRFHLVAAELPDRGRGPAAGDGPLPAWLS